MTTGKSEDLHVRRLYIIAILALFTAGAAHSLRAGIIGEMQQLYFVPLGALYATQMSGEVLGTAFIGFAVTLFFASPLLDFIGMKRMMILAASSISAGVGLLLVSDIVAEGADTVTVIRIGVLVMGIGWGCIEATINPLVAALYPDQKTGKINALHAWWPGGLIVGGLAALLLATGELGWKVKISLLFLPSIAILLLVRGMIFPATERASAGIPWGDMMKEVFRSPGFIVWMVAILLAAGSELSPGQFVDVVLTETVGMRGIWILVYVSGLMFVMRHFAGALMHKISPVALMFYSSILTIIGLYGLSLANSPLTALAAATVWGTGVCFLWPTILASVSERFPRGGAFFIGLVATAGAASSTFFLPMMGRIFDQAKQEYAGGADAFMQLTAEELHKALVYAASETFQAIAMLPAGLVIIFALIWLWDRSRAKLSASPGGKE